MAQSGKTATLVFADSEKALCIQYHETIVYKQNQYTGLITLNSGGWRTQTTKARINQYFSQLNQPYYLFQKNGDWYVENLNTKKRLLFIDKMTLPIIS